VFVTSCHSVPVLSQPTKSGGTRTTTTTIYLSISMGWVALKNFLEEFVYFAVKICQHAKFLSATST